ncbi:MAG: DUF92 domain-containing protein [Planctomycetota bacterium]
MDPDWKQIGIGLAVNVGCGIVAFAAKTVGLSGLIVGSILGASLWALAGWQGWVIFVAFFVIGSSLTKFGAKEKEARGIAEEKGGRRGAKNAIAKLLPGVIAAVFATILGDPAGAWHAAFVATFATAAADTAGTEVGKAIGRTPILLTTFRRAKPGEIGAVSVEGTVAGLIAGALLAALGGFLNYYSPVAAWKGAVIVTIAAFGGNVFESWINAFMAGRKKLNHEVSNFLLCVAGGALAYALVILLK